MINQDLAHLAIPAILGLAIGSFPTGFLIGRYYGVDLRSRGSGNVGATNAGRVLGKKVGGTVLALDMLKGVIVVLLARWWSDLPSVHALGALAAVAGHCFSPFLHFKGGKGVATGFGAFVVVSPAAALAAIAVFFVLLRTFRYVSLGSIVAALSFPVFLALLSPDRVEAGQFFFALAASAIVVVRHSTNIGRLLRGEENRMGRPKTVTVSSSSGH